MSKDKFPDADQREALIMFDLAIRLAVYCQMHSSKAVLLAASWVDHEALGCDGAERTGLEVIATTMRELEKGGT